MILRWPRIKNSFGQSAAELAIFGSIVIFVIGLILKTAFSVSSRSNTDLRAFRRALQESYRTANGRYAGEFSGARNNAAILILEDRLGIDPSQKTGSRDRFPLMAQGSGTMTHSLFMDISPTDIYDQAVFDLFVNGQRFPLSTSQYRTVSLKNERDDGEIPDCYDEDGPYDAVSGAGAILSYGERDLLKGFGGRCYDTVSGNFVFFRREPNGENGTWCDDVTKICKPDSDGGLWPADRRFDLNFNGDGAGDVEVPDVEFLLNGNSVRLREHFGWQWERVEGTEDNMYQGLRVDIDGDFLPERVDECTFTAGKLEKCDVIDSQEGDIDLTVDDGVKARYEDWRSAYVATHPDVADPGPFQDPGLGQDMTMYSFTQDGTKVRNIEGKLYSSDGQFIRNETTQDHIDIIERILHLSNETGRFCALNGTVDKPCGIKDACSPTDWTQGNWAQRQGLLNMTNPVEACGQCFSVVGGVDRSKLTCMETVHSPVIFVRSRLRDQRKSKWITRTEER